MLWLRLQNKLILFKFIGVLIYTIYYKNIKLQLLYIEKI